jgi:hypothetical protein
MRRQCHRKQQRMKRTLEINQQLTAANHGCSV